MRREPPRQPRKAIRFPLEAPIVFQWADSGSEKRGEGRTRDISETGAFVLSRTCPPAGAEISFNIFLPLLPDFEPKTRVFFQAEDGIRDLTVTGVQTCALPI